MFRSSFTCYINISLCRITTYQIQINAKGNVKNNENSTTNPPNILRYGKMIRTGDGKSQNNKNDHINQNKISTSWLV